MRLKMRWHYIKLTNSAGDQSMGTCSSMTLDVTKMVNPTQPPHGSISVVWVVWLECVTVQKEREFREATERK